jgi:ABC-type lipoprotein export system ATPase subunit
MVQITDMQFRYGESGFRLDIPTLEIGLAEKVSFIGPSGSGKTTLLNLIAGISVPENGQIRIGTREITGLSDANRRNFRVSNIGLVFQQFELLEYLSVLDNIVLPYRINPTLALTSAVRERAEHLADQVGIADKLGRYPHRLSQGERQRVAVCRAVMTEPSLVLADEPTGNLDPANKMRVLDILLEYIDSNGATLVTVTHDHEILERFDRVVDFRDFHSPQDIHRQRDDRE